MHRFSANDSLYKLSLTVLFIDTFNYNLSRYLCDLLSPLIPSEYSFKDTFSFVCQIKSANLTGKCFSYYVTSVFINIPLQQTIDIGINFILNNNLNLNITKKGLKKYLFCIIFLFTTKLIV